MRNYYYTHLFSFFKFFLRIFIKNYARRFFLPLWCFETTARIRGNF